MLRPLPFMTFRDIAVLNLEANVYCSRCYALRRVDPSADHVRDRCFAGTRFRCRRCDTPGQLQIQPPELLPVGGAVRLAFLWCKTCVPSWEISYIPIDRPPWNAVNAGKGDRFQCPACGGRVSWHMHGKSWKPTYPYGEQSAVIPPAEDAG
jgi:hypothetical protein